MSVRIIPKERQAKGAFNGGEIVENKPIGFPREGGELRPYSNLFYWAHAKALTDSTIGLHPHEGFEIMSFILKGTIRHYDTKLNEWRTLKAGDAQIIRAGSGISHAEFMAKDAAMFQIWFDPDLSKTLSKPASYDDYKLEDLPVLTENGITVTTYIGEGSPITMDTPGLEVLRIEMDNTAYRHPSDVSKVYSLYVLDGSVNVNGQDGVIDDFIIVENEPGLVLGATEHAEVFIIGSPAEINYRTYARMFARI